MLGRHCLFFIYRLIPCPMHHLPCLLVGGGNLPRYIGIIEEESLRYICYVVIGSFFIYRLIPCPMHHLPCLLVGGGNLPLYIGIIEEESSSDIC